MNESFLETEKLIHSLSDELLKLKSAIEQYESSRNSLDAIRDSIQKVEESSVGLFESTKGFLTKLDQMEIGKKFEQLQDSTSKLMQSNSQQIEALNIVQKNLDQHDQTMKLRSDEYASKLSLSQRLIFVLLALQAVTLLAAFLR